MSNIHDDIREMTGFKEGEFNVTCTSCGYALCRGKFCPKCGNQIVAGNYENLTQSIRDGRLDPNELLDRLNKEHDFRVQGEKLQEHHQSLIDNELIILEKS